MCLNWVQCAYFVVIVTILVPLRLPAADLTVPGRAVDENNTPLANVRITLRPEPPFEASEVPVTAVSDAAGVFSFHIRPGAYLLIAEREGFFAIRDRPVRITETAETLEIVVTRL